MRRNSGVTLLEILVVLVVITISAGLTVMAFRTQPAKQDTETALLARARREAIEGGKAVRVTGRSGPDSTTLRLYLALPDGRVIRAPGQGWTGEARGH